MSINSDENCMMRLHWFSMKFNHLVVSRCECKHLSFSVSFRFESGEIVVFFLFCFYFLFFLRWVLNRIHFTHCNVWLHLLIASRFSSFDFFFLTFKWTTLSIFYTNYYDAASAASHYYFDISFKLETLLIFFFLISRNKYRETRYFGLVHCIWLTEFCCIFLFSLLSIYVRSMLIVAFND